MKIIGNTGPRTFIIEVSAEEIDYLAGLKIGEDQREYDRLHRKIYVGTTFNISPAWDRLHRDQKRQDEVEAVKQHLRSILASLEMIGPFIEEPKPPAPSPDTITKAADCTCR